MKRSDLKSEEGGHTHVRTLKVKFGCGEKISSRDTCNKHK